MMAVWVAAETGTMAGNGNPVGIVDNRRHFYIDYNLIFRQHFTSWFSDSGTVIFHVLSPPERIPQN